MGVAEAARVVPPSRPRAANPAILGVPTGLSSPVSITDALPESGGGEPPHLRQGVVTDRREARGVAAKRHSSPQVDEMNARCRVVSKWRRLPPPDQRHRAPAARRGARRRARRAGPCRAAGHLGQRPEATLVVTFTDGEENASRRFARHQIHSLVSAKQEQGWSFVFLDAGLDTYAESGAIGYAAGAMQSWGTRGAGRRRGLRQPVPLHRRLPPPCALGHGCCQRRLLRRRGGRGRSAAPGVGGSVAADPTGPRARMIGSGGRRGRRMTDHG